MKRVFFLSSSLSSLLQIFMRIVEVVVPVMGVLFILTKKQDVFAGESLVQSVKGQVYVGVANDFSVGSENIWK